MHLVKDMLEFNITLIETLEHIPVDKIKSFIKGIDYYLKKDGLLLITVPSKNIAVQPKHYQHFDIKSLTNTLNPLFLIKEQYFINKISYWTKLLESILNNRFFILNEQHLLNMLYRGYEKYLFLAKEKNARRIKEMDAIRKWEDFPFGNLLPCMNDI